MTEVAFCLSLRDVYLHQHDKLEQKFLGVPTAKPKAARLSNKGPWRFGLSGEHSVVYLVKSHIVTCFRKVQAG